MNNKVLNRNINALPFSCFLINKYVKRQTEYSDTLIKNATVVSVVLITFCLNVDNHLLSSHFLFNMLMLLNMVVEMLQKSKFLLYVLNLRYMFHCKFIIYLCTLYVFLFLLYISVFTLFDFKFA